MDFGEDEDDNFSIFNKDNFNPSEIPENNLHNQNNNIQNDNNHNNKNNNLYVIDSNTNLNNNQNGLNILKSNNNNYYSQNIKEQNKYSNNNNNQKNPLNFNNSQKFSNSDNNSKYDIFSSEKKSVEKEKENINNNHLNFNINDYELDDYVDMDLLITNELIASFETACSEYVSQEEKLKIFGDIIEKEQEFLTTKNWQYRAFEQRLLIFIENLDKNQVAYTFKQLLQLKNEVDEQTSEKTMENIIRILKNKEVINYSRPIVSVVVNLLHEIKGTEKYYRQLLEFLQSNKYFFIEDTSKLKFQIDLIMPYIKDIDIFNLEVHIIGNEEKPKTIGKQYYYPPYGWTCYEFNIYLKYDNGDNSWMKMEGKDGEWAIAYHGVARNKNNEQIFDAIDNIVKNNLRQGVNQQYCLVENINVETQKLYPKCGKGVYVTPRISTAQAYAGILNIDGKRYYTVLQFRVNPLYLRIAKGKTDYWICEGNRDGVRPYRLLLKEK